MQILLAELDESLTTDKLFKEFSIFSCSQTNSGSYECIHFPKYLNFPCTQISVITLQTKNSSLDCSLLNACEVGSLT